METITNKEVKEIFRNKEFTINKNGDFETTFTLDELNKIVDYMDLLEKQIETSSTENDKASITYKRQFKFLKTKSEYDEQILKLKGGK